MSRSKLLRDFLLYTTLATCTSGVLAQESGGEARRARENDRAREEARARDERRSADMKAAEQKANHDSFYKEQKGPQASASDLKNATAQKAAADAGKQLHNSGVTDARPANHDNKAPNSGGSKPASDSSNSRGRTPGK